MQEILNILLAIIAEQGPEYPEKNPYPTYTAMLNRGADPKKARLVLLTLLAGIPEMARKATKEELSEAIQKECCLKSKPAESLSTMYSKLYSTSQEAAWEDQKEKGFRAFCKGTWHLIWEGESTWDGDGVHMDCSASVTADLVVTDALFAHKAVEDMLKGNPFTDESTIWDRISADLSATLDGELNAYVTGDPYYEPYMDDFWSNTDLIEICDRLGLAIVEDSDEYDASSSDFIPDDDRYW